MTAQPGNVVILNGTMSAGKTTTAKALQEVMETPYLLMGTDRFLGSVPARFSTILDRTDAPTPEYFGLIYEGAREVRTAQTEDGESTFALAPFRGVRLGPGALHLYEGMFRALAALSAAGVDTVADVCFHDPRMLEVAARSLAGTPALFVGLRISREMVMQRERERGDRAPGSCLIYYEEVHDPGIYDLEIDTGKRNPREGALQIKEALAQGRAGGALKKLTEYLG